MHVGQLATVQRSSMSQPSVSLFLTDNPEDEDNCLQLVDGTCVLLLERCVRAHEAGGELVEFRVLVDGVTGWISAWNLQEP